MPGPVALGRYHPDVQPNAADWLALPEEQRLVLVLAHHPESGASLPNARLHAAIHVVIENQVALGDPAAAPETLQRLQSEGLSRHDAIHMIGTAVSELLLEAGGPGANSATMLKHYTNRLRRLTARHVIDDRHDEPEP